VPPRLVEISHGSPAYERTVVLREAVLRRPLGLAFSREELDAETTSHHLVALGDDGETVLACLVLEPRPGDGAVVKMRQVAVAPEHQRRGLGTALVAFAERFARARGYGEIVLHAREHMAAFYDRLGYERTGARFIEVTLPHVAMRKRLALGL
jgi:ribosomal protein S18 acetylase RimI-like enzyme